MNHDPIAASNGTSHNTAADSVLRHRMFVYGTLKHNQPNHFHFYSPEIGGRSQFVGVGQSTEAFPLIIATKWNLPFLLYAPGKGKIINGEIYNVDDELLNWMDSFEGHPEVYKRDKIEVRMTSTSESSPSHLSSPVCSIGDANKEFNDDVDSNAKTTGVRRDDVSKASNEEDSGKQQTISCWVYFLKDFPPGLLQNESYESYDAHGKKPYQPTEELTGADKIAEQLLLES